MKHKLTSLLLAAALFAGMTGCSKPAPTGSTLTVPVEHSYKSAQLDMTLGRVDHSLPLGDDLLLFDRHETDTAANYHVLRFDASENELSEIPLTMPALQDGAYHSVIQVQKAADGFTVIYGITGGESLPYCVQSWYDADCKLKKTQTLPADAQEVSLFAGVWQDTKGHYLTYGNDDAGFQVLRVFDADFRETGMISDQIAYYNGVVIGADGTLYLAYADTNDGHHFAEINASEHTLRKFPVSGLEKGWYGISSGSGEYDFYFHNDDGLYGVTVESGVPAPLINWKNSDFEGHMINHAAMLADGRCLITLMDYETGTSEIWLLSRRTEEELANMKCITMATMGCYGTLLDSVYEYNRSHADSRIMLYEYQQFNTEEDPDAGIAKFKQDMTDGLVADIICTDELPFEMLANKGMFEDLTGYMKADERFHEEDFYMNFLDALSYGGKRQRIAFDFGIRTLAARSAHVGARTGYTAKEFAALTASLPDDRKAFCWINKQTALEEFCMYNLSSFVDVKKGTCRFDSDDFISLLELCDTWENGAYFSELAFEEKIPIAAEREDSILRDESVFWTEYLYSPYGYHALIAGTFGGEDVTLTGFPKGTDAGNGGVFQTENVLAMCSQSLYKDEIWDFFMLQLSEEKQSMSGFPVRRSSMEKAMQTALDFDDGTTYVGSREVKIGPATQEEMDEMAAYIEGITVCDYYNEEIWQVVREEADMYFAGDQTAAQAAEKIQGRVSLYLSEQS
ncbi:MAG: hypothetical protein IJN11_00080 [Oscillospiraceae bacterium]|nr:hypothetical protein [Oscillospiraceae bacterium]